MRARAVLIVALILGAVCRVAGQTTTADGVVALARGDYQRAVEILKPIAEDWRTDDPVAQFFMAGLFDTGRGVAADPLRACALYMRASIRHDTAFGREAIRLLAAAVLRGLEFNEDCQLLANIGFDNGFEPVTFDLGPGYFVEWTLSSATVTYQGRTNRVQTGFMLRGARFLPLQHTELDTGSTRSEKRHFVEMFVWRPGGPKTAAWELYWHLFEVVADQVIRIETLGPIASSDADAPPARESFDVREHALLRVDAEGHAEWAVLTGPRPASQRIESEAERREIREASLASARALKAVDWEKRLDVSRVPTLATIDAEGCGNIEVFGWSADRAEALVVRGTALGLSTVAKTFDIATERLGLSIDAHVYAAPQRDFRFCSDVSMPPDPALPPPETWHAVAGAITIELSAPGIRSRQPYLRRATITLANVVLRNAAGNMVKVAGPVRLTALVGSFSG